MLGFEDYLAASCQAATKAPLRQAQLDPLLLELFLIERFGKP